MKLAFLKWTMAFNVTAIIMSLRIRNFTFIGQNFQLFYELMEKMFQLLNGNAIDSNASTTDDE